MSIPLDKITYLNRIAVAYFFLFTFSTVYISWTLTIPLAYTDGYQILKQKLFLFYLLISVLLNYSLTYYYSKSNYNNNNADLPVFETSEWNRYCEHCKQKIPPRAKHCIICQRCILKCDHHCFFIACCIGFRNQRYFIVLATVCLFVIIWSVVHLLYYFSAYYVPLFSLSFYKFMLPYAVYSWLTGGTQFTMLLLIFYLYTCVLAFAGIGYFLCLQIIMIGTGQTNYELMHGITRYKRHFTENVRSIFGPYWFINFLFPAFWIKNCGDGVSWNFNAHTKHL